MIYYPLKWEIEVISAEMYALPGQKNSKSLSSEAGQIMDRYCRSYMKWARR